jgi:hypothetical protein
MFLEQFHSTYVPRCSRSTLAIVPLDRFTDSILNSLLDRFDKRPNLYIRIFNRSCTIEYQFADVISTDKIPLLSLSVEDFDTTYTGRHE